MGHTEPVRIAAFTELEVYRVSYRASLDVMTQVASKLPDHERYDLRSQLMRSCKAVPRLIAEGFAKRHQKHGFQKYLDDAIGECNEMIVSLSHAKDLYMDGAARPQYSALIDTYDRLARQLYTLARVWNRWKNTPHPDPIPNPGLYPHPRTIPNVKVESVRNNQQEES